MQVSILRWLEPGRQEDLSDFANTMTTSIIIANRKPEMFKFHGYRERMQDQKRHGVP